VSLNHILSIALTLFLVTNPIGNIPVIVALVKNFDFEKQRRIIFRESIISLIVALFFQFFGEVFLGLLNIQTYTVTICGGILLFIVALSMIFAKPSNGNERTSLKEPFIVPIATPILSGPGLMAIIMLYSRQEDSIMVITSAILIAWIGVIGVLAIAPYLQKILGKRGLIALEQLMGMILAAMSMGMIVNGVALFIKSLQSDIGF
jgi:MarC family membrane protein